MDSSSSMDMMRSYDQRRNLYCASLEKEGIVSYRSRLTDDISLPVHSSAMLASSSIGVGSGIRGVETRRGIGTRACRVETRKGIGIRTRWVETRRRIGTGTRWIKTGRRVSTGTRWIRVRDRVRNLWCHCLLFHDSSFFLKNGLHS